MNTRILLCEDDPNLGSLLREYLVAKDYEVDLMPDGELGYQAFVENEYDLCIFDVMMPNKDGFTLASDIRKKDTKVPIIFLTVKALKQDILEGFKIGADDYITKPFSMEELLFRIEAIMRRVNMQKLQLGTRNTNSVVLCSTIKNRYSPSTKRNTNSQPKKPKCSVLCCKTPTRYSNEMQH